jgi:N-acyl-D-aspartate/D-glutamate deacylase
MKEIQEMNRGKCLTPKNKAASLDLLLIISFRFSSEFHSTQVNKKWSSQKEYVNTIEATTQRDEFGIFIKHQALGCFPMFFGLRPNRGWVLYL